MGTAKINLTNSNNLKEVNRQEIKAPFYLRPNTSDLSVYEQIFTNQEYDFITNVSPQTIVDAGTLYL